MKDFTLLGQQDVTITWSIRDINIIEYYIYSCPFYTEIYSTSHKIRKRGGKMYVMNSFTEEAYKHVIKRYRVAYKCIKYMQFITKEERTCMCNLFQCVVISPPQISQFARETNTDDQITIWSGKRCVLTQWLQCYIYVCSFLIVSN